MVWLLAVGVWLGDEPFDAFISSPVTGQIRMESQSFYCILGWRRTGMGESEKEPKVTDEGLLSPAEVAALFRVDPKTVTRWAKAGKLSSIRSLGGHRRYRETEIRHILRAVGAEDIFAESSGARDVVVKLRTVQQREKEHVLEELLAPRPVRELSSAGAIDSGHSDLSERIEELLYGPAPAVKDNG
jgi:excisionase family DNA binding protein